MILKPFFYYYGGKYRIAPKYPKPLYETIIEPFAGSAGYSMRYFDLKINLYDIDPIISGLWGYLIKVKEREILSLSLEITHLDEMNLCQEAKWLIGFWVNKGVSQPRKQPSKWMRGKTHPNSFWGEVIRKRISSQLKYIRHWKIHNKNYEEIENKEATWFIDPPYQNMGKHYMFNEINYKKLKQFCVGRIGQAIVCENEGADWMSFHALCDARSTTGTSKEVVWTN